MAVSIATAAFKPWQKLPALNAYPDAAGFGALALAILLAAGLAAQLGAVQVTKRAPLTLAMVGLFGLLLAIVSIFFVVLVLLGSVT